MDSETLKIFDHHKNCIGVASREEVHRLGLWHEAFHCWFVGKEEGTNYIYLQKRSHRKKDYPNLFDITAAGHLLANESAEDGVREIKEEIGIDLSFNELIPLGVVTYTFKNEIIIDNEFAHVYLYETKHSFDEFILQEDEVEGMVRVPFHQFYDLWMGTEERVQIDGFRMLDDGTRVGVIGEAGKRQFVEYTHAYFETVLTGIRKYLDES